MELKPFSLSHTRHPLSASHLFCQVFGLWVRLLEIVLRALESCHTLENVDCGIEPILADFAGFVMAGTYEHSAG